MFVFFLIIHVICSIALIAIVLLQAGRGGLSGAFGSGMGETVFGSRTGDVLTKATTGVAVCFMVTSIVLATLSAQRYSSVIKTTHQGSTQGVAGDLVKNVVQQVGDKVKAVSGGFKKVSKETQQAVPAESQPVVKTVKYEYDKFGNQMVKEEQVSDAEKAPAVASVEPVVDAAPATHAQIDQPAQTAQQSADAASPGGDTVAK